MSPQLIYAVAGLALSVLTLSQVTPSLIGALDNKRAEVGQSKEEALAQHIAQYRSLEGQFPSTVTELINKGYWRAQDNDNGFGGGYTFSVDEAKGVLAISTTIANAANRSSYANAARRTFRGQELAGGEVRTTFILPATGSLAVPVQQAANSRIAASPTAPDATKNLYWYDTSGSQAVLKVSNGSGWVAQGGAASSGGSGASASIPSPNAENIINNPSALPTTGQDGDIRYVYNAAAGTLDRLIYFNGGWNQSVTGATAVTNPNSVTLGLNNSPLPVPSVGEAYSVDLFGRLSAAAASGTALPLTRDEVTWQFIGSLGQGMSLDRRTGILSGTPTQQSAGPASAPNLSILATARGAFVEQRYNFATTPPRLLATQVAAGERHHCAVTTGGGVACWGENTSGQLGDGTTQSSAIPRQVIGLGSGVRSVAVGSSHSCAVLISGAVQCWGSNSAGQLGITGASNTTSPVAVPALTTGVSSLAAYGNSNCAIDGVNQVRCWGSNLAWHLGTAETTDSPTPRIAAGIANATSVVMGAAHVCVMRGVGAISCWGSGKLGQLGNNGSSGSRTPVAVASPPSDAVELAAGTNHTCARRAAGSISCWGQGTSGQLATGNYSNYYAPKAATVSEPATRIWAFQDASCVTTAAGTVSCWGNTFYSNTAEYSAYRTASGPVTTGFSDGVIGVAGPQIPGDAMFLIKSDGSIRWLRSSVDVFLQAW